MSKIKFILNGKEVTAQGDKTILETAEAEGISIPTLCHDPNLEPFTSCFICVVEVEGRRGLVPSCATKITEGMIVRTNTEAVQRARKLCLELLLSDHYGDCLAPCQMACPAGIRVKEYVALIREGQYREAVRVIKENNPLPSICGRVCVRFCEDACRRNLVDEPVAINFLKRFAADYDLASETSSQPASPSSPSSQSAIRNPQSGHRVALIGAGPASLSAAYYLSLKEHTCTIFEALPKPGGMLRYGIPEYRLPKAVLDKEIQAITDLGTEIRTGQRLGEDFDLESLFDQGFEAAFLGIGAQGSYTLGVEGEEAEGVLSGVEFLRDIGLGKDVRVFGRVAIIGGGNTAIDAARSALRLGADEVVLVYRRSRQEMPANNYEIHEAELEGVKYHFLAAPTRVVSRNGRVSEIECIKMELGEPDADGRRRPVPVEGSEFKIKVDFVIAAIGQFPETTGLDKAKIELGRGRIKVQPGVYLTTRQGVFAAGDAVTGAATAIEAIAGGRQAAGAIDQYLEQESRGAGEQRINNVEIETLQPPFNVSKGELSEIDRAEFETVEQRPRVRMPELTTEKRLSGFDEVELGLEEDPAVAEAGRCLECGCLAVSDCYLRKYAAEYKPDLNKFKEGAVHKYSVDTSNPLVIHDPNKCIRCGRCVRICAEIKQLGALGFVNRGFDAIIKPTFDKPLAETTCDSCGKCVIACPTGALFGEFNL
ncbi:MAG: FAD-dependent oxidoreductase, partial [bacterium]|nr:FAD-dependent oxidoreductase [bacterium]